jgi:hypothetical protein
MGINHLELTPELIATLYPDSLVMESGIRANIQRDTTVKEIRYPFLGGNQGFICFLVNYPDHAFMPAEQLSFLEKIIKACKFTLEDVAIINTSTHPVEIAELRKQLGPRFIFLWGAVPAVLGKFNDFPDMEISDFDGISVLPVLMADAMIRENKEGPELKQKLWVQLKKIFRL